MCRGANPRRRPRPPARNLTPPISSPDETEDEFLHQHCTFMGVFTPKDQASARREAVRRHANLVEPMSSAVTWEPGSTGVAKLFDCPARPETVAR